ncbi:MAG: sugar phosphorylase, partial [Caldilineaceae bacterium]|nr:sugar phosphorylase [Caldilineaceae bacterium]
MPSASPGMRDFLESVYGDQASDLERRIQARVAAFRARNPQLHTSPVPPDQRLSARDVMLITYGDQIQDGVRPPLQVLDETLRELVGDTINSVHILPFFPYTSDDGFSVVDYQAIDPALGDWQNVRTMAEHFRLMFDAVINHISQASSWFQAFKRGEAPYTDYFITVDPATDLSAVVRPRTLPLLTPVETARGLQHVWTTFSADQIDLNYACPDLLLEVLDALLLYVEQGAQCIRLDAIGFMWKELGTSCIHLPQT